MTTRILLFMILATLMQAGAAGQTPERELRGEDARQSPAAADAATSGPQAAVHDHVLALESSHMNQDLVGEFEQRRFSPKMMQSTSAEQRQALLQQIQQAAAQAGGAMIDMQNDTYQLTLEGREVYQVAFTLEPSAPYRIDSLAVARQERQQLSLDWDTLAATFDQLAAGGFSGVVRVQRAGEVVLERAYGTANAALAAPMRMDTIFGIGSTPIDFTVAALFLLADQGKLTLDDPIGKYLPGVPADKASMTLRHIIRGQSGLPDFHDQPGDWEPDLAWIDRGEALRRILAQPLGFAPGSGQAHSHSAYGLAAAVIELVSGQGYFDFLDQNLFQPAGMRRTGMYGDAGDLGLADFAEGRSELGVGLPNIPPNWGPTSWLVMGSGGMYSTLDDLRRFYEHVGGGTALSRDFARHFTGERMVVGGSQRGFHIVEVQRDPDTWALFLINQDGRNEQVSALTRALHRLLLGVPDAAEVE